MVELLPVLLILACPLGMAAMMAGPVVLRKVTRSHVTANAGGGHGRVGAD